MGLYSCIHDCGVDKYGSNCHCVSIISSLDFYQSSTWVILCSKHNNIVIGSKFQYVFNSFYDNFRKKESNIRNESLVRDVEVIDTRNFKTMRGTVKVVRFRTKLDCSSLDESKKINFSMFDDDVTSWCKENDDDIITLQILPGDIYRPQYKGNDLHYCWMRNLVFR